MLTDIQIAQLAKVKHIDVIAKKAGINKKYLEPYGNNKAKVNLDIMKELENKKDGKLVLVTAINPTKAGEGKTTMTIGLGQALSKIGRNTVGWSFNIIKTDTAKEARKRRNKLYKKLYEDGKLTKRQQNINKLDSFLDQ